jgi:hypothetical protein
MVSDHDTTGIGRHVILIQRLTTFSINKHVDIYISAYDALLEISSSGTDMLVIEKKFEDTEGAIKNGQYRENDNIGFTRHRTNSSKRKSTTYKTKTMSNMDLNENRG